MNNDEKILSLLKGGRLFVDFTTGNVFSPRSNMPSKPIGATNHKGYLRTCINNEGRRFFFLVHRIVWIAAHGIPSEGMQIDHKNGNKIDNRISNLDLVTGLENMKRAARMGLTKGGWKDGVRDKKGRFIGKKAAGHILDGKEYLEVPDA